MITVSVCLPSDALSQHLPSYLGFSYPGGSLHVCPSTAQPLLLTLDEEYLLTTTYPDLERGVAPLSPPAPTQPMPANLESSAVATGLEKVSFNSNLKEKAMPKNDQTTIQLHSSHKLVMLKILQARIQQYMNQESPDVQYEFRKGRGTRYQIANIHWIIEKEREFQKKSLLLLY